MNKTTLLAGIAIFSMFFGAGNVIFPLKIGLIAGDQITYAIIGLLLTAIGGPLLGLITATLYRGNCLTFFCRPGKILGVIFISISLLLLGPFAVIPRCFVVAYASYTTLFTNTNLLLFSSLLGALSLVCCLKPSLILPLLGRFFSPLLLLALLAIIVVGIATGTTTLPSSELTAGGAFFHGIVEGFDTMDLIAAIFFSSSIWTLLWIKLKDEKILAKTAIYGGLIGGTLLGLIYLGLSLATAYHATELATTPPEKLMSTLALITLGPMWSHLANLAIILACFTTIVGLTQTIASLCEKEFFPKTLSQQSYMVGIILIAVAFSTLGFSRISSILHPLIAICYPAIIVLTLCNLLNKLYGFQTIRRPVYAILAVTTLIKLTQFIPL